jgi:calcium-dependent protein kinase
MGNCCVGGSGGGGGNPNKPAKQKKGAKPNPFSIDYNRSAPPTATTNRLVVLRERTGGHGLASGQAR